MAINSDSLDVPVYTRLLRRRPPSSSAGLARSLAFPASSVYILSPWKPSRALGSIELVVKIAWPMCWVYMYRVVVVVGTCVVESISTRKENESRDPVSAQAVSLHRDATAPATALYMQTQRSYTRWTFVLSSLMTSNLPKVSVQVAKRVGQDFLLDLLATTLLARVWNHQMILILSLYYPIAITFIMHVNWRLSCRFWLFLWKPLSSSRFYQRFSC